MKQNTRRVVFTALTVAMTTVLTLVSIALPGGGYYNFGDLAIFVSAIVLGPVSGLITGAIGAALGDVILGYFAYVPFTMIAKALEGLIAGLIAKAAVKYSKKFHKSEMLEAFLSTLGNLLGGLVMAGVYYITPSTGTSIHNSPYPWEFQGGFPVSPPIRKTQTIVSAGKM